MSLLDRFFRPDAGDVAERHGEASRFLGWASTAETVRFLDRLEKEAGKNIDITDATKMIASSVRANTLREVAGWLRGDIKHAQEDLRATEEELRNVG